MLRKTIDRLISEETQVDIIMIQAIANLTIKLFIEMNQN